MYQCSNERYTHETETYATVDEFLAMCQASFGDQPRLRQDGDDYRDEHMEIALVYVPSPATLAQPVADDDIRRPREVQLLVAQLAAAGLELRQLRTGEHPTNSQLRRGVGIAGSYHVALAELRGQKTCPGGRWPKCEGQLD